MKTVYIIKREVCSHEILNSPLFVSGKNSMTSNKMIAVHFEDYDSAQGYIRNLLNSSDKYLDNVLFSIEKFFKIAR